MRQLFQGFTCFAGEHVLDWKGTIILACDRRLHDSYYDVNQWREDFDAREMSDWNSFTLFITVKTIANLNQEHSDIFEIKIKKITHGCSRSPDKAKFGHFMLNCFAEDGKEMYKDLQLTHVHSYCNVL